MKRHPLWRRGGTWLALLLLLPILALTVEALSRSSPVFLHLHQTVLWDYVGNSIKLCLGVVGLALIWGVPSAWLVARYRFPGRSAFRWALLLPLALPAYLAAFVYTEWLDYAGVVQRTIRQLFGFQNANDYPFFEIRSMGGAMFVLSLMFAPYVYWLCLIYFERFPASIWHSARLLGASEKRLFWRIALPLARPAIAVGCTLVAMETLADFGTAHYFSVWHLTTGIYDVWLAQYDLPAAAKLSLLMLLFILALISLERWQRRHLRAQPHQDAPLPPSDLSTGKRFLAMFWCSLILALSFVLPLLWLLQAAWRYLPDTDWAQFAQMSRHTLSVAGSASLLTVILAFILHAAQRQHGHSLVIRLASMGYAIPGTVLAIGVLIVTTRFDHALNDSLKALQQPTVGLVLSGTLVAITYAFVCRFAAIALGSVESGFAQIPRQLDESAYLLGQSRGRVACQLWLPLLRPSLFTAALLVFLESMKELSAAMLLRPFNVQTLATYVYEYIGAERFEMAALPALVMVLAGLPTVLLLMMSTRPPCPTCR